MFFALSPLRGGSTAGAGSPRPWPWSPHFRGSIFETKREPLARPYASSEADRALVGGGDSTPGAAQGPRGRALRDAPPAPASRHIFSPAVGNLVCERIAAGETLNQIASEPGMPSRSTIDRWCTDRPEFKRQYDIAVQLRADGLLEETIEIIDD